MSHTPYKVTLKESPRARSIHTWIRFGESAELVAEQLRTDPDLGWPEAVILAVEPTADPRGAKVRELAAAAPRFSSGYDPARARARSVKPTDSLTGYTLRRPMARCDALSPADSRRK